MFRILVFGDIFGKIGRRAIQTVLPEMRKRYKPTYIIANGENVSHGTGVTESSLKELLNAGVDCVTSGNHIFDKKEANQLLGDIENWRLLRPANYPPQVSGSGEFLLVDKKYSLLVINLMGRIFFRENFDCPFRALDVILSRYRDNRPNGIIVDFHSEASSEASAFGLYADGRVSVVAGTHTHVGTVDTRVLPKGTAYVTDIGMVGAVNSIIGAKQEPIIESFLTQVKPRIEPVETGLCRIGAILVSIEEKTGKAKKIQRVDEEVFIA